MKPVAYLGVDGGGTKTRFALIDGDGRLLGEAELGTTYHPHVGQDGVHAVLTEGVAKVLGAANLTLADIGYAFFGLPAYGEDSRAMAQLQACPATILGHHRYTCDNDMVCGWAGPLACADFGGEAVDDVTEACFLEAMSDELEGIGFRTEPGFDGLAARGTLWGGNLCVVNSLLGTPHWPAAKATRGGILFLEDVNEHPYRIERNLLQLHQAGVLDQQRAVLLGSFSEYRKSPLDRGFTLKTVIAHLRSLTKTPILTGLPFGHVPTKVTLPVGRRVNLLVQGRDVLIGW